MHHSLFCFMCITQILIVFYVFVIVKIHVFIFKSHCTTDILMLCAHQPPGFHNVHTCEEEVFVNLYTKIDQ